MGSPSQNSRWERAKKKKEEDNDPRRCPTCKDMGKRVYIIDQKRYVSLDNILHCKKCGIIFIKEGV